MGSLDQELGNSMGVGQEGTPIKMANLGMPGIVLSTFGIYT